MACTHTLSPHSPTACGGIGAITHTVGAAILTMAGDGTAGTVRAGASAGVAGTVAGTAAGGDTITTITPIIPVGTMAAVTGVVAPIGEMPIPTGVLTGRAALLMPEAECHLLLPAVLPR